MATIRASDGVALNVEVHGEGPAVVISNGLHTTLENWRPQLGPLQAAGYRVALWDYRGHGASEAPDDPDRYSMEQVVDDLGRVVERAAGDAPAVLCGLSFGGLASLHFALAAPERVRALLLVATGPGFKNPEARARWQASLERTAGRLEREGLAGFVASRAVDIAVGRRRELPAAQRALAAIARQTPHGLIHFGRRIAGPAPAVIDRLGEIRAPTLVLVGEEDAAYQRAAELMATRIPGAESARIAGAGHIVNLEAVDAFNARILEFLAGVEARAA